MAKEVENIDEEIESDKALVVKVMNSIDKSMDGGMKEKNKDVPPKTFMKIT